MVNSERNLTLLQQSIPPPGEARPDWQLIAGVAREWGSATQFDYTSPRRSSTRSGGSSNPRTGYDLRGVTYERLRETPVQWPAARGRPGGPTTATRSATSTTGCSQDLFVDADGHRPGWRSPRRAAGRVLRAPAPGRRRAARRRLPVRAQHRPAAAPVAHPDQDRQGRQAQQAQPGPFVEIHPEDAAALGIADGDRSRSPRGAAGRCCPPWSPTGCGPGTASRRSTGTTCTASTSASTPSPTTPSTRLVPAGVQGVRGQPAPGERGRRPVRGDLIAAALGLGSTRPTLTEDEKLYLAGFLAGLERRRTPAFRCCRHGAPVRADAAVDRRGAGRPVLAAGRRGAPAAVATATGPLVLWASQTGNAEEFAAGSADRTRGARPGQTWTTSTLPRPRRCARRPGRHQHLRRRRPARQRRRLLGAAARADAPALAGSATRCSARRLVLRRLLRPRASRSTPGSPSSARPSCSTAPTASLRRRADGPSGSTRCRGCCATRPTRAIRRASPPSPGPPPSPSRSPAPSPLLARWPATGADRSRLGEGGPPVRLRHLRARRRRTRPATRSASTPATTPRSSTVARRHRTARPRRSVEVDGDEQHPARRADQLLRHPQGHPGPRAASSPSTVRDRDVASCWASSATSSTAWLVDRNDGIDLVPSSPSGPTPRVAAGAGAPDAAAATRSRRARWSARTRSS